MSGYTIRPLRTNEELKACVDMQEEIWGPGFSETVPVAILKTAQRIGGVCAGAFGEPDDRLLGFVFGMTGIENGELSHWSDMLAVRPGVRESGLGLELKRYQRSMLLERGVRTMRWSFDPLVAKNAYLNLEKLGAVSEEYIVDMYGSTSSPLHQGIGTDRLIALWRLEDPRVVRKMESGAAGTSARPEGRNEPAGPSGGELDAPRLDGAVEVIPLERTEGESGHAAPGAPLLERTEERLLLAVPADIQRVKAASPPLARAWRDATRSAFVQYLARGYRVERFARGPELSRYLLSRKSPAGAGAAK